MELEVGDATVHWVEHGRGSPVLVLHGAGVDHREAEACFDPALAGGDVHRRIYPDLPGMGRSTAPPSLTSADDVLDILKGFVDEVVGTDDVLLVGHSAGAYYAQGYTARHPDRVAGLALICPLLAGTHDVPAHAPVTARDDLGDAGLRDYFVLQTPEMLARYEQYVSPAAELVDTAAMERIGQRWELTTPPGKPYAGPVLLIAGRRDSTVGWAATADLFLAALLGDWLRRAAAPGSNA
ncbi:alpha/beta hydrolase [Tersicoccus phoenicis]|uniref:Alpha/beta hydrolase n=1 Tax=Tersicoccus phoenicis TaxID=554083 RepID=A0A1R1LKW3_9MICC|nr:alpha/beta fold hydrolase [Tersicoccus phoenicis]OMH28180.1 alpha/beta hydrolase [Tersicoccus phoenicis]